MSRRTFQSGFTLLELALVLVVLGLLLGGLLRPLLANRELLLQRRAELQLNDARNALLGFASRNGRLPCPASIDSGGSERASSSGCEAYAGYLPSVELGLMGPLGAQGQMLGPWSKAIHYRLSDKDSDSDGVADFAATNAMRRAGLSNLAGDLKVYHWQGHDCDSLQLRASHVVAVVYLDAKNTHGSRAERLNQALGRRFATGAFSQSGDCGFDDQLIWLSDSALFTQMLRARQLP